MLKGPSQTALTPIIVAPNGEVKGQYALSQIIALHQAFKCDFEKASDTVSVKGTIFIAEDSLNKSEVSGDFQITNSPVGNIESHFITKDNISYTWTSLVNIGYKKAVTDTASTNSSPSDQASIVGNNDKVNYDCSPWIPVESRFTLPNNVIFKDLK